MRDLTKSMLSFSWGMSVFGLRQMADLLMPQSWGSAASRFDAVTQNASGQLGSWSQSMFKAGDNLQRGMVDMMFGMLGTDAVQKTIDAGARLMKQGVDAARDAGKSAGEQVGWGPMPGGGA
jgi:hypothetical protein